jgi:hypothetical protein
VRLLPLRLTVTSLGGWRGGRGISVLTMLVLDFLRGNSAACRTNRSAAFGTSSALSRHRGDLSVAGHSGPQGWRCRR